MKNLFVTYALTAAIAGAVSIESIPSVEINIGLGNGDKTEPVDETEKVVEVIEEEPKEEIPEEPVVESTETEPEEPSETEEDVIEEPVVEESDSPVEEPEVSDEPVEEEPQPVVDCSRDVFDAELQEITEKTKAIDDIINQYIGELFYLNY